MRRNSSSNTQKSLSKVSAAKVGGGAPRSAAINAADKETRGKENRIVNTNLSKSRQLNHMDKHIQQAILALKESANFERTQNIRQALQEKYSLSRSSSLGTLHRSQGKNQDSDNSMRRISILHPNALRRQVSPRLPKYASSGTFGCTFKAL